jgi:hypothetical protein
MMMSAIYNLILGTTPFLLASPIRLAAAEYSVFYPYRLRLVSRASTGSLYGRQVHKTKAFTLVKCHGTLRLELVY